MPTPRARYFNTTGPCDPRLHYMLPPAPWLPEARTLIEMDRYFVLHAPRQTGKRTILEALASELAAEGDTAALVFSCEEAKSAGDDIGWAEGLAQLDRYLDRLTLDTGVLVIFDRRPEAPLEGTRRLRPSHHPGRPASHRPARVSLRTDLMSAGRSMIVRRPVPTSRRLGSACRFGQPLFAAVFRHLLWKVENEFHGRHT